MHSNKSGSQGFTLIELMVVVAIIAILAGIAYPSYIEHVKKTRRSAAAACLTERAQYMERFYTSNMAYDKDTNNVAVSIPDTACKSDSSPYYNFNNPPSNLSSTTYTVTATPIGSQASDSCGTLSLNQAGTKLANNVANPKCF